jgi:hypothetical protein
VVFNRHSALVRRLSGGVANRQSVAGDMQSQNIVRAFFFCAFFSIGAAVLSGSVLCNVLLQYYHNKQLLEAQQLRTSHLKSLIADYNALLTEIEKDPNFVKRIAPATFGTRPDDANVIYPKAPDGLQIAARKVLAEEPNQTLTELPAWLIRCSEPRQRIMLLFAGAALILISFICFGSTKQTKQTQ